jgi:hypothetical protein
MKELYHIEGAVDRGFQGQITYMVCLEKPCTKLDVHLTYDFAELRYRDDKIPKSEIVRVFGSEEKYRRCPEITPEVLQKTINEVSVMSGCVITPEEARKYLIYDIDLKTEIHPLATLNDEFIGCIHKQKPDRHMIFTRSTASHGCIPREVYEGVLKITLLVFNVAKDNTRYTLTVSGH